jgi:hypothetical protein
MHQRRMPAATNLTPWLQQIPRASATLSPSQVAFLERQKRDRGGAPNSASSVRLPTALPSAGTYPLPTAPTLLASRLPSLQCSHSMPATAVLPRALTTQAHQPGLSAFWADAGAHRRLRSVAEPAGVPRPPQTGDGWGTSALPIPALDSCVWCLRHHTLAFLPQHDPLSIIQPKHARLCRSVGETHAIRHRVDPHCLSVRL